MWPTEDYQPNLPLPPASELSTTLLFWLTLTVLTALFSVALGICFQLSQLSIGKIEKKKQLLQIQ